MSNIKLLDWLNPNDDGFIKSKLLYLRIDNFMYYIGDEGKTIIGTGTYSDSDLKYKTSTNRTIKTCVAWSKTFRDAEVLCYE